MLTALKEPGLDGVLNICRCTNTNNLLQNHYLHQLRWLIQTNLKDTYLYKIKTDSQQLETFWQHPPVSLSETKHQPKALIEPVVEDKHKVTTTSEISQEPLLLPTISFLFLSTERFKIKHHGSCAASLLKIKSVKFLKNLSAWIQQNKSFPNSVAAMMINSHQQQLSVDVAQIRFSQSCDLITSVCGQEKNETKTNFNAHIKGCNNLITKHPWGFV